MGAVQEAQTRATIPDGDMDELTREALHLKNKAEALLPVEQDVRAAITTRMRELERISHQVLFHEKTKLQMIPLDVLRWTMKVRFGGVLTRNLLVPKLALVPVVGESAEQAFYSDDFHRGRIGANSYPEAITQCYEPVTRQLGLAGQDADKNINLSYVYKGAIPDATRDKIKLAIADGHFHDATAIRMSDRPDESIYLLCEAPASEWAIRTQNIPRPPRPRLLDPLVVGYAHNALWLIDAFDPTPVEQYIALEHATVPQLPVGDTLG